MAIDSLRVRRPGIHPFERDELETLAGA